MDLTVKLLAPHHDRAAFTCGDASLDAYIQRQARQDIRRDLAVCYVLCVTGGSQIIGYYTLSALAIEVTALPPEMAKTAGRYQLVPAVLLGRLAVDSRFAGQGMGSLLMYNAMRRVLRTGIGVKAIVVDALDERAAHYYERFDFKCFADNPLRLYLPLNKVRDIFPGEGAAPDAP